MEEYRWNQEEERTGENWGLYLFCFASERELFLPPPSPENSRKSQIFRWTFKEVLAVFCRVALDGWTGPEAQENLENLSWIGPRVCHHLEVVEGLMKQTSVFPLPFGSLLTSFSKLQKLTCRHHGKILHFLNFIEGREEWLLQGWLYQYKMSPLVSSNLSSPFLLSSLELSGWQEERIGRDHPLKLWLKRVRKVLLKKLGGWVVKWNSIKIPAEDIPQEDRVMVFRWALLMEQKNLPVLFFLIEEINQEYSRTGLRLEVTGPFAPYNFCPSIDMEFPPH